VTLDSSVVEGDLPPAADATAYRIIQEGLTNVIKHGGPVAHVRVDCTDGVLNIEITDDGRPGGSSDTPVGTGQGLVGMRERVAMFEGEFTAAHRQGGGFRLHASLPYARSTT
jgi:signal transduction histidine kinase